MDGPDGSYKQTSLIVDPRDGLLPYTPDARKAEARSAARYGVGPYESYLDPDTGERCLTDGVTALMWQGPNGGHNMIVQSPGYVTILHEEYRDRRIIPVDGRPHGNIRQWFGDAVGRWEADTLVVDTTNFLDRTNYEWANIWTRPTETLHLVERFTRISADTIEYKITVEDPATFSRPWTASIPDLAACRRHADLRVRVSRGKPGDAQSAQRRPGRRGEAAGVVEVR